MWRLAMISDFIFSLSNCLYTKDMSKAALKYLVFKTICYISKSKENMLISYNLVHVDYPSDT